MRVNGNRAGTGVRMSRLVMTALVVAIVCAAARPAFAQQTAPNTPTAAQDQYVPVKQPANPSDTLPAPKMLATAYAFVWVVLLLYLWSIRRRLATVEKEIASVSRRVAQGNPRA
jgi:CcmD family protein